MATRLLGRSAPNLGAARQPSAERKRDFIMLSVYDPSKLGSGTTRSRALIQTIQSYSNCENVLNAKTATRHRRSWKS